ncbi:MAG TPA: Fur family transcriptional regulator, partial [Victivallales bacterium]|nr:Fur family transcriptional regulator [Victivallales bacterium]
MQNKTKKQNSIQKFRKLCRDSGLKFTQQRFEIFNELIISTVHPDAMIIFKNIRKKIPSISFDTVYRTLRTFEEKGIIKLIGVWGDKQRFDGNNEKHHHFICLACGKILDINDNEIDNLVIPREVYKVGYPKYIHVEIRGICSDCNCKS